MKQRIYGYQDSSGIDIELLLDINRELTENDKKQIRKAMGLLVEEIQAESVRLDPREQEIAKQIKQQMIGLFAGKLIFIEEIPNGYCSSYCCRHLPWYIITTNKGKIKIGWRKRVINIDWSDSVIKKTANDLFPSEDTTKGDYSIHAWNYEKAKEYIDVLLKGE